MTTMSTFPGFYTSEEAADVIGVSQSMLSRYIKRELLKPVRVKNIVLFEQSEVHNFKRPPRGNPNFRKD